MNGKIYWEMNREINEKSNGNKLKHTKEINEEIDREINEKK